MIIQTGVFKLKYGRERVLADVLGKIVNVFSGLLSVEYGSCLNHPQYTHVYILSFDTLESYNAYNQSKRSRGAYCLWQELIEDHVVFEGEVSREYSMSM